MQMDEEGIRERIRLLRTPIDFAALIKDGILAREGAWYRILDYDRVPAHVWVQIGSAKTGEDGVVQFRFPGRADPTEGT